MIKVETDDHYAAARFRGVLSGGKWVRRPTAGLSNHGGGELLEYVLPDGEVLSRKVVACGAVECWLRADVAAQARAALAAEAAEHARVVASVADFIKDTDAAGAKRNGVTVEQYRAQRHAKGAAWDNYRARQRAGGF
jgi:hypothetical protein